MTSRIRPSSLLASFVAALSIVVATASARADTPDQATRTSARQLGEEATDLFDKGDYKAALDKFERADALIPLPTLRVREARCLVKLGRLIDASDRYLGATRMQLPPDALQVHRDAIVDAEKELAALQGRIPALVIDVADGAGAEVTVDGANVPAALWGQKRAVDPGKHRVAIRKGTSRSERDIEIKEGQTLPVKLEAPKGGEPTPPLAPTANPEKRAAPQVSPPSRSGSGQLIAGAVTVGVGGAAIVVGAVTGGLVLSKKSDLEKTCGKDLACPRPQWDEVDSYNRLRIVSTSMLVVGGVVAAAGTVVVLTSPKPKPEEKAAVAPWIGAGSAGFQGVFW